MIRFIPSERADNAPSIPTAVVAGGYVFVHADAISRLSGQSSAGFSDTATETRFVIDKLRSVLAGQGLTLADVIRANCYLSDNSLRPAFWATWGEAFAGLNPPVRCTYAAALPAGCTVVLDVTALRPHH